MKTEGLKEVKTALRKLPDSTAKGVMRRVMKKVLIPVRDQARQLAPEDDGDLKNSIVISTKLSKAQRRKYRKHDRSDVSMFVGAGPLPHAHLQEYGTERHGVQPFMRPAWDNNKRRVFKSIRDEMWTEIRKTVERQKKRAAKKAGK